jgi:UDP-N-acetylmuramate dehydrogenase
MPQLVDKLSLRGQLRLQEKLADYTSWHVGGVARQLYLPADLEDLAVFLSTLPVDEPIVWLGLGSNVLIRDGGLNATVIITQGALKELQHLGDGTVYAQAGVPCAKLAKFCVKEHFAEGAFFAGIPGTVGGALAMNAGAFGGETWPHVVAVDTIDHQGHIKRRTPEEFQIAYREVKGLTNEWFVAGYFRFATGDGEQTQQAIRQLLQRRNQTQPIGTFNCGSVFRNPPGDHAGRLIEACGLKGKTLGGAMVSPKHANFIINDGNATAADVEQLITLVQQTVLEKMGVALIRECHILGEYDT